MNRHRLHPAYNFIIIIVIILPLVGYVHFCVVTLLPNIMMFGRISWRNYFIYTVYKSRGVQVAVVHVFMWVCDVLESIYREQSRCRRRCVRMGYLYTRACARCAHMYDEQHKRCVWMRPVSVYTVKVISRLTYMWEVGSFWELPLCLCRAQCDVHMNRTETVQRENRSIIMCGIGLV